MPFWLSPAYVRPRSARYSLVNDDTLSAGHSTIRVYKAISTQGDADFDPALSAELEAIQASPDYATDPYGASGTWMRTKAGVTFKVSPAAKLLMLGVIKFSSMDPYGMGVEMEGGKPGTAHFVWLLLCSLQEKRCIPIFFVEIAPIHLK